MNWPALHKEDKFFVQYIIYHGDDGDDRLEGFPTKEELIKFIQDQEDEYKDNFSYLAYQADIKPIRIAVSTKTEIEVIE